MNSETTLDTIPAPANLGDTIAAIQILFLALASLDAQFGLNHGADQGRPARFDGWQHPRIVTWAERRSKTPRTLDGPELHILRLSLAKELVRLRQAAIAAENHPQ